MNLVSIDSLSKTLKDAPLFEGLSLGIDSDDRIGLIGRNGCGKSSFLKLLTGELLPDSGTIARARGLRIAVLEQSPAFGEGDAIRDFLFAGNAPEMALVREYEEALESAHAGKGAEKRLAELTHRMEEGGGFELEHRFASVLTELGIDDLSLPMASLSGGMAKKAAIARCLAPAADLVLLDEPTNHLDVETIEWLERRLSGAGFAFILVTHDRYFLQAVCNGILEIDGRRVRSFPGSYSTFLKRKEERIQAADAAEARRRNILRDELEWLERGPQARSGKSRSRIQRIEAMVGDEPEKARTMEGFSAATTRLGRKVLELEAVAKSYGDKPVIEPFTRVFTKGEKIGVIGPNGSGKTTILGILDGRLEPSSGRIERGQNTSFKSFTQDASGIDRGLTVLEYMKRAGERILLPDGVSISAEQFLERFLFPRSMHPQTLSFLSGGEIRRLQLIRLLAEAGNFLLLDEPTNDLDTDTIGLLEDFLESYPGCALVVSHDRSFLDRVVDSLLVLDGSGSIREYPGNYSDFRQAVPSGYAVRGAEPAARRAETNRAASKPDGRAPEGRSPANARGAGQAADAKAEKGKKLSFKEQREFDAILDEIDALERERAALEAGFSLAGRDAKAMGIEAARYAELAVLIEEKTKRWEELAERA